MDVNSAEALKTTKNKKRIFHIEVYILFITISTLILSCANMRSPEGGPIDKTPPKVLKMEPTDLTRNFKENKIIITFDEYFKIQNEAKEFTISPEQERPPLLKVDKKKLEIIFQDTLEKNTTYTLNFGNGIVDIHEGNILKNLTYAFSTGPILDSLTISGKVISSQTGKPVFDATVFILPLNKDTIFGKKRPSILTSTDSSGNYQLKNLKQDRYKIYALKETGGDKIYQQRTDEIGFLKEPIMLNKNLDSINLEIFKENAQEFRILDKKLNLDGSISMLFNQALNKPEVSILNNPKINESKIVRFNKAGDSLKMWLKDLTFDSIQVSVLADKKALDTVQFSREKKDTYSRTLTQIDNIENSTLNPYRPLIFQFNFPIENIDISKIKLTEDSIPKTNFKFEKDSTHVLNWKFIYPWKRKLNYVLTLDEGAITGIFGVKNKPIRKLFRLGTADDYGSFIFKVEVPDTTQQYIIEILNDKKIVVSSEIITKNKTLTYSNYKVGNYTTRIIYDDNKNGKWDTGNVRLGTQPERIYNHPEERTVRANYVVTLNFPIPPKPTTGQAKKQESKPK